MRRNGNGSLQVKLMNNTSSSANWAVRLLSSAGTPSANTQLSRTNGRVGFRVYAGGVGMTAALAVDDSDGTERSIARSIPANIWTYLEWSLTDANQVGCLGRRQRRDYGIQRHAGCDLAVPCPDQLQRLRPHRRRADQELSASPERLQTASARSSKRQRPHSGPLFFGARCDQPAARFFTS